MAEPKVVHVVDDEPQVLMSLCAYLGARGFAVQGFTAAEDLLKEVDLQAVGCVVTDLRMPGMDGAELQDRLRASGSSLAVVVATGHADSSAVAALLQNGSVAVLEKPYNLRDMEEAIHQGLEHSRLERQQRATR